MGPSVDRRQFLKGLSVAVSANCVSPAAFAIPALLDKGESPVPASVAGENPPAAAPSEFPSRPAGNSASESLGLMARI